ncbi:Argininosuccinate synthase, partial [Olavius algarvensis spirochete endosymbiont]|uniref:argininosuccinate synthase n=1 Tax=Olavius algarvensis spirochete endosymbiont TaxID=260710 RepID=UPI000F245405
MKSKVILAYSGGLDTTLSLKKLMDDGYEVVTVTINIGNEKNWKQVQEKAISQGAREALVYDLREEFADDFIANALRAGALYENKYPLATALGRPLIARKLVEVAIEKSADIIAHGCSGKGNDQLRFEHTIRFLHPRIEILAPIRDNQVKRSLAKDYQESLDVQISENLSVFSIDENIWGRSIECDVLEDAWESPPEEIYRITRPVEKTPNRGAEIEIDFVEGLPVALNGESYSFLDIIESLNSEGGNHGIGRIDMIENRVIGIKSREIYEAPAASILHTAHAELESLTLSKKQIEFKQSVAR